MIVTRLVAGATARRTGHVGANTAGHHVHALRDLPDGRTPDALDAAGVANRMRTAREPIDRTAAAPFIKPRAESLSGRDGELHGGFALGTAGLGFARDVLGHMLEMLLGHAHGQVLFPIRM